MPRPPQHERIARMAALLELDDAVRETRAIPHLDEVRTTLGLAELSARLVRSHLVSRHGLTPPPEPAPQPRCVRLSSEFPPMPAGLTPAEQSCYFALATASKPLSAAAMYASAFNYPFDPASDGVGRAHISHMRRKGVAIESAHGIGYWLAAKEVGACPR